MNKNTNARIKKAIVEYVRTVAEMDRRRRVPKGAMSLTELVVRDLPRELKKHVPKALMGAIKQDRRKGKIERKRIRKDCLFDGVSSLRFLFH